MPYDHFIDDERRTIVVRGHGRGTTADTLRLIEDLQATLRSREEYDFLYDSTQLEIKSSPTDMMRIAKALFGDAGAKFRRFAIVVPASRLILARIFAALAQPYGVTANVFGDEESAREWLAERRR